MAYKYDGAPLIITFKSPQNLDLCGYLWGGREVESRGVVVLLHGVRAHTRLTWLVKRHRDLDGKTPYSIHSYTGRSPDGHRRLRVRTDTHRKGEDSEDALLHFSNLDDSDLVGVCDEERNSNVFYQGSWVQGFVNSGFAVFGMDLQGHGMSQAYENRRCFVRHFDDFRDDVLLFLRTQVRSRYPTLPLFVVGVSMSGQIVMRVAQDLRTQDLGITGIVSMAGLLTVAPQFRKLPMKAVLRAATPMARFAPRFPIGRYRSDTAPRWQREVGDVDPLLYKGPFTAKIVAETVTGIESVVASMPDVAYNGSCQHLLFLHNKEDPVCYYGGSVDAFGTISDALTDNPSSSACKPLQSLTFILFNAHRLHSEEIKPGSHLSDREPSTPSNSTSPSWTADEDCSDSRAELTNSDCMVKFVQDKTPLNIHHTLANDMDHAYVFGKLLSWIEEKMPISNHS
eukprot:Blabericola_migrator_1__13561@NODE_995_length_5755_cov_170_782525_g684_i0_p2_GENE_NODE_995_length_5755_cov_170_782525_g684_i0NODE_995_length_5755_cov_170_782525_g684_i0_p2_ORF_typecomplete_len453_score41_99Hydrolase_4/PF12146_8/2_2e03Hydrolase_4/PF12146_8/9_4e29Abhydrolase_6/PF12697_7/7_4e08Abhydrolase_1/PF00561_20/1_4e07DLH/PF01738_18/3_6e03DLH/PF01738_18/0_0018DLH/PF01738_18/5_8e03DUF1100/PF06500_11/0_0088Abhydrolase_3/PF07859_13/0_022Peptidase_S15/PF02129_18/0_032Thioesterase/PF00975_20/0_088